MDILHVGASGLVGKLVLRRLLDAPQVTRVVAPTRRPLNIQHPKLVNPVVDFDALDEDADWWTVDAVICTLGTTIADARSQAAFYRVDHDYPLQVARFARNRGAMRYVLNSAMGANARSKIFYNRVKGELEQALANLDYPSLVLVRPGLIEGQRAQARPAEARMLAISRWLGPLLPKQWRPSLATRIADELVTAALDAPPGRSVVEADSLHAH